MPQYCFQCMACLHVDTQFRVIPDRNRYAVCSKCGHSSHRDMRAEGSPNSMNDAFYKPIEMYSIAPNTPAEKRQLQEAGATFDKETGVPLARTRSEKLRLLEVVGYVETK